jgi:hypothetical protein
MKETDLQKEKRILRDGYDIEDQHAVLREVRRRRERQETAQGVIERLEVAMASLKSDPREFAAMDQLIMQVSELKKRDVGPEPFILVKRARASLDKRRATFFKSAGAKHERHAAGSQRTPILSDHAHAPHFCYASPSTCNSRCGSRILSQKIYRDVGATLHVI